MHKSFVLLTVMPILIAGWVSAQAAATAPGTWPMFRHDAQHSGRTTETGSLKGALKWKKEVEPVRALVTGSAGTLYLAGRGITTLRPEDGSQKWFYDKGSFTGDYYFDLSVTGAGIVFAARDNYVESDPHLFGLSSAGELKWRSNYAASHVVLGSDGTAYFCAGQIVALTPDKQVRWRRGACDTDPVIGADGTVYAISNPGSSSQHYLVAFAQDGTYKFRKRFDAPPYSFASPAVGPDGTIYAVHSAGDLFALDPQGKVKWRYAVGIDSSQSAPAIASDGTIYVQSGGFLIALSPKGTLRWKIAVGPRSLSSPAVDAGGTIYMSGGRSLLAIRPNGTLLWKKEIGSPATPPILANGIVYVGAYADPDHYMLYAFQ